MTELWDHQKKALESLSNGKILAGGVGSGKSRTAIAYWQKTGIEHIYVITTAMKRDSLEWQKDFAQMGLYHDGVIDQIHIDSWHKIHHYTEIKDALFIFDEQKLVGSGKWVKSFYKIAKNNHWILLSGTPGDTWLDFIPVFVANGFYKNRSEFIDQHVIFDRFAHYPKVKDFRGTHRLAQLRSQILVPMPVERHTERHAIPIKCDYDRDIYQEGTKNRFDIFKEEPMQNASALCLFQRKVVNTSESRQKKALSLIEEHPRLIIFYNFDYELEILRGLVEKTGKPCFERNGHRHDKLEDKLPEWVFLVQYSSGSEAWNCITTDRMMFYSQTYSWKVREQAMGRIDRMNTRFRELYYYELTSDSSIDTSIRRCIAKKKDFNEKAYAGVG